MSEAKFTPGPWSRNIRPAKKFTTVFAGRNTHICRLVGEHIDDESAEANISLIAAAPELYCALKDAVERLRFAAKKLDNADFVIDAMAKPFEDLLAKARGES